MKKFGDFICKHKTIVIAICLLLLIPSLIGIKNTRINYDILVYLPNDIETMKGQAILANDFKMGAYSISIIDNMNAKDVIKLENEIRSIDGVNEVASLYDVIGTTIPIDMLPKEVKDKLYKNNTTLLFVTFKDSISDDKTLEAVTSLRKLSDNIKVGGMSSMVLDTRNLSDKEVTIYVVIAVILCIIVLMISLDSYAVPFILLGNIGIAILFNMGSNILLGNISYITKAISSILQLGVTMDFSIFLYHKYEDAKKQYTNNNEAMSYAIKDTAVSVFGSSLTTMAGFLALCTMTLTLGKDIGLVMTKGVLLGVICVLTLFPALLLVFDKTITKTKHKPLIPEFKHVKSFTIKHYKAIFAIFLILIIPSFYGQTNTSVYYNLDKSLPNTLESSIANNALKKDYNIVSPEIILVDKNLSNNNVSEMIENIKELDGIDFAISYSNLVSSGISKDAFPKELTNMLETDKYQLILVNSLYETATEKLNNQINKVNEIVKKYDSNAIVAGEGPLMKDLTQISDTDFTNVTYASLIVIIIIMMLVLKSASLPIILVSAIEFAIFINMGIPFYTGTKIPFIASIVIGTIQLGATIDYAILMTTKYLDERKQGKEKIEAMKTALDNSVSSIFVSGMCFFAATFGVGIYSKLEMIGSLCTLISRGAIISMVVVIMVLPSLLLIFDKVIVKTTVGFKKEKNMKNKNTKKIVTVVMIILTVFAPITVFAKDKDETVYATLSSDGSVKSVKVIDQLINTSSVENLEDLTNLNNIKNLNGDESFVIDNNSLTWKTTGSDIYYEGTTEKALPVSVEATYKLDGNEIQESDLEGKSGKVDITLKFINNNKHIINGNTLYTPFTIFMATTLNTTDNRNIAVTNGKIISTGTTNIVVAVASPGLYESLNLDEIKDLDKITISFDTTNFRLGSVYNVITPKVLDLDDLKVFDKLDTLYSSNDALTESTNKLVNGSNKLLLGIQEYNQNFETFKDGVNSINEASNTITNKYTEIDTGVGQINMGITELQTATASVDQLAQGLNNLAIGIQNLSTSTSTLDAEVTSMITTLNNHVQSLYVIASATTDLNTKTALEAEITTLTSSIDTTTLTNLKSSIDAINTGTQTLNANGTALATGAATLTPAINSLKQGSDALKNGSTTFKTGLEAFNLNMDIINQSTIKLNAGSKAIESGTKELNDGLIAFNDQGISKINNYVSKIKSLSNKVEELNTLSNNYKIFTQAKSGITSEVKFIYMLEK